MKDKLLKDIDIQPVPECPSHLKRGGSTEGIIVLREGFKYIVAEPFIKPCQYLYDLNIRSVSCGSNGQNEIGISVDYNSLDEGNKVLIDRYLKENNIPLEQPTFHHDDTRFRIGVKVDFETDTIKSAEHKLMQEILKIGLQKQDVLYGKTTIENYFKLMSAWGMNPSIETMKKTLKEDGGYLDGETVWISNELYEKHKQFVAEQKLKNDSSWGV